MRKAVLIVLLPCITLGVAYFLHTPINQDSKHVHRYIKPGLEILHRVEREIRAKSKDTLSVRLDKLRMGYDQAGVLRMCGKVGSLSDINNDATWRMFIGEITPDGTSMYVIEEMQSPGDLLVVCRSRGL